MRGAWRGLTTPTRVAGGQLFQVLSWAGWTGFVSGILLEPYWHCPQQLSILHPFVVTFDPSYIDPLDPVLREFGCNAILPLVFAIWRPPKHSPHPHV